MTQLFDLVLGQLLKKFQLGCLFLAFFLGGSLTVCPNDKGERLLKLVDESDVPRLLIVLNFDFLIEVFLKANFHFARLDVLEFAG